MTVTPQPRTGAALVRTAPARRPPPQTPQRTPRNPALGIPPLVAFAAITAGWALSHLPLPVAFAVPAAAGAAGIVMVRRTVHGTADDWHDAQQAVAATAAVTAAAATGLSLWTVLVAVVLTVVAVRRIRRHPSHLSWKAQQGRRQMLDRIAADWPRIAATLGRPDVAVTGPPIDRAPASYTLRVVATGKNLLTGFETFKAKIADELGVPVSRITIYVDDEWPRQGTITVREQDPQELAANIADAEVDTILQPLPIGSYVDNGQPYPLRLADEDNGGTDLLITGGKGYGKSSLIVRLLKLLRPASDVVLLMWDGAEGRDFEPMRDCFYRYTQEPREAAHQAMTLEALVRNRAKDMTRRGWRVWRPSPKHPVVALIVSEMATFGSSTYADQIRGPLTRLSKKNRAVDVLIIGETQEAYEALGKGIRAGMDNRIEFPSRDGAASILTNYPRQQIPTGTRGMFVGETVGENRRIPAQVVWTPDSDRAWIVKNWTPRDEAFAAEWARAERDAHGEPAVEQPAQADAEVPPQRTPDEPAADVVVDGVVLRVREGARLPDPVDLGPQQPELDYDQAAAAFDALLIAEGRATAEQVMDMAGRKRRWVRDNLINPAVDAGRLHPIDVPGTGRVYEADPEWLAAERRARS